MRRSRTATTALTALLGLGTIIGLALPAQAEAPATQNGTKIASAPGGGHPTGGIIAAPVTTTTTKPQLPKAPPKPAQPPAADFDITGIPAGPVDPHVPTGGQTVNGTTGGGPTDDPCAPTASCPQDGECTPGTTADPDCRPGDDCTPIPGANDPCDEPDCTPIPGASDHCPDPGGECGDDAIARNDCDDRPCDERPNQPRHGSDDCDDDPCDDRPSQPRDRGDDCGDPCDGDVPDHAPRTTDERCDDGGTDGGTTGGTTGGGGRLPRTGAELTTMAIAGLGLTGVGAALRKLGRIGRKRTA